MKLTGIKAFPISIPQKKPFTTHRETMLQRDYVVIKVYTDEGIVGIAEASTIDTWGEPQQACVYAIENILSPAITGEDPFDVRRILYKMDRALEYFWYSKAAVDVALYDIMGKALGVPTYKLLGGQYREAVPTSRSVGITEPADAIEWGKMLHDELGSQTIKVKVGIKVQDDVAIVRGIRKAVGESVLLKVDANQGYGDAKTAISALRAMEAFGIRVVEQPVIASDLDGMATVRRAIEAHLAADESVWHAKDVISIYQKQAADVLTIYIAKAGGMTRNLEVAAVAKACGMGCILGGMGELGLGSAANVHFAAACDNLVFPGDLHIPPYHLADDIIAEPLHFDRDLIQIPQGNGLGITLDEEKLEKYTSL